MPEPPLRDGAAPARARRDATAFFDEHVEADAVHEAIAAVDLAGGLARQEPELAGDILLGRPRARRARGPLGRAAARRLGGVASRSLLPAAVAPVT